MTSRSIEQENAIAVEEINMSVTVSASKKKRGGKRKKVKEVFSSSSPLLFRLPLEISKESNNLCNRNKHSGLENKKIVTIEPADKEQGVVLGITKTKKQNRRKLSVNKFFLKKEFPKMIKAIVN
ncbi:unnamed protein product [Microthlaspi erraticum]|uniref:Ribosomal eL28/Mak16 domain-containing protein n=1 Tax=Microthlaspi erraticum TaxID=1685480 RepID=A0A6D2KYI8_9BRAS|nr:unnamed protein product [Microthlaspi erraticum]